MSARHVRRPAAEVIDIGPVIRRQRGEIEVSDRADPDAPSRTVRAASRHDPVRAMVGRGDLDFAHYVAAERFRTDHALAEGAREMAAGGTAPWQRCYTDRQLDAVTARTAAIQAVGLRCGAVFVAAVLEQMPVRAIERDLHMRSGAASGVLREALARLTDHYGKSC